VIAVPAPTTTVPMLPILSAIRIVLLEEVCLEPIALLGA